VPAGSRYQAVTWYRYLGLRSGGVGWYPVHWLAVPARRNCTPGLGAVAQWGRNFEEGRSEREEEGKKGKGRIGEGRGEDASGSGGAGAGGDAAGPRRGLYAGRDIEFGNKVSEDGGNK